MNLPNSNWQDHNAANQRSMERAQRAYDNQGPPEDCGDGEHHFVTIKISSKDGETSITKRCEYCGEIVETLTWNTHLSP